MKHQELFNKFKDYVLDTFGFLLDGAQLIQFEKFLNLLSDWNQKINLVSFKSEEEVIFRHFADSLAVTKFVKTGAGMHACDIGAGAGFPGMPLKIALPELDLTLVESIGKKCSFMEETAGTLCLKNARIINKRVEDIAHSGQMREKYDILLSRAVAQLSVNLELAAPLLRAGGTAFIFKTAENDETADISGAANLLGMKLSESFDYKLPGNERIYRLLKFDKISKTPGAYPRTPAAISKKPLG